MPVSGATAAIPESPPLVPSQSPSGTLPLQSATSPPMHDELAQGISSPSCGSRPQPAKTALKKQRPRDPKSPNSASKFTSTLPSLPDPSSTRNTLAPQRGHSVLTDKNLSGLPQSELPNLGTAAHKGGIYAPNAHLPSFANPAAIDVEPHSPTTSACSQYSDWDFISNSES